MKHIVVDIEMNNISKAFKEARDACEMETIQIGAVVLDEKYQEIGHFDTLVKPELNDGIRPYITKLTGIRTEMVKEAPVFCNALRMFLSWCRGFQDEIRIYQWSETDLHQLRTEAAYKQCELDEEDEKILSGWIDLQRRFGDELGLERSISLKNAVMYAGVDFVGKQHDALYDARNTGALLEILNTPQKRKNSLDRVIAALKPEPTFLTIGDLIKLQGLAV